MPPLNAPTAPVYIQVRDRIAAMIVDGDIAPGSLLPSVRSVAADLQVNPMTVHKGYQALVELGVIETDTGRGMLVLPKARDRLLQLERERFLAHDWPTVLATIQRLGLDPELLMADLNGDDNS